MTRKIIDVVVALLAILLAAAVAIPLLVPLDTWKPAIVARVKDATGRVLRIDGPMHLSLLPRVELELVDVGLSNAPGGGSAEMIRLEKLTLALKLIPLLSGELAVDTFVLTRPRIEFEIDPKGHLNWDFSTAPSNGASTATGAAGAPVSMGPRGLRLEDVHIVGGTLQYLDRRSGADEVLSDVDIEMSLPSLDEASHAAGRFAWKKKAIKVDLAVEKPGGWITGAGSPMVAKVESEPLTLDYRGQASATAVQGDIDLAVPSMRALAAWVGVPIEARPGILGPLRIRGKLATGQGNYAFTGANIAIDHLSGGGDVTVHTGAAKTRIDASLSIDNLDLNPYLGPPASSAAPAPSADAGPGEWSADPIALPALNGAEFNLDLAIGGAGIRDFRFGKGHVVAQWIGKRLSMDLASLSLYGGNATGHVAVDGSKGEVATEVDLELKSVDLEPLLRAAGGSGRLSGRGNGTVAVKGKGKSPRDIVATLEGKGRVALDDGTIRGINLTAMVLQVASAFTGDHSTEKTVFSAMTGTFAIEGGVLKNRDLALRSPELRVAGEGTIDLNKRFVDFRVSPKFVAPVVGDATQKGIGVKVPVRIRGPWNNLGFGPDVVGLIREGVMLPGAVLEGAFDITTHPGALFRGKKDSAAKAPPTKSPAKKSKSGR